MNIVASWWWLFLIAVVFFALGWCAARIDIRQLLAEARSMPRMYFEGLNHLLNDQPEKAIEAFMEVADKDKDPKSLDLHFALGTLFRRQGEFSRAIRIHKSLLERPSLSREERERAQFELAQDFHRAGLLDRAENLFNNMEGAKYEGHALSDLLEIYETEKKWMDAIRVTRQMEAVGKTPRFKEIAQYYCEMAQEAIVKKDYDEAQACIDNAFKEYKGCARAFLIKGDILLARNDLDGALASWNEISRHSPKTLSLAAGRVMKLCRDSGDTARMEYGMRLLSRWQDDDPSPDIFTALFSLSCALHAKEPKATIRMVKDEINKRPSLLNLNYLLEIQIAAAADPAERQSLTKVKELIVPYLKKLGFYRCSHCGFRSRHYYWRCPGCQKWETTEPKRNDAAAEQK